MKKVICATLALMLLTASLAACNNIDDEIENTKPLTSETTTDNINSEANEQISVFATYNSTISIYKKAVENALLFDLQKEADGTYNAMFEFTSKKEKEWYHKIFKSCLAYRSKSNRCYGYSISDINDDGIDELILMLEDYTILAIFSMYNGKPVLLDSFTSTYNGYISADGQIYTHECHTPTTTVQRVYQISETFDCLKQISEMGTDHLDLERGTGCYKLAGSEKVAITTKEYNDLYNDLFHAQPLWETEIQIKDNTAIKFTPLVLSDFNSDSYDLFFNDFIENNPIDINYYKYCEENISNSLMLPTIQWVLYWYDEFDLTLAQMNVLFDDKTAYEVWKTKMIEWKEYIQYESKIDGENLYGTLPRTELQLLYGEVIRRKVIELKYDMFTAGIADPTISISWYVSTDYMSGHD